MACDSKYGLPMLGCCSPVYGINETAVIYCEVKGHREFGIILGIPYDAQEWDEETQSYKSLWDERNYNRWNVYRDFSIITSTPLGTRYETRNFYDGEWNQVFSGDESVLGTDDEPILYYVSTALESASATNLVYPVYQNFEPYAKVGEQVQSLNSRYDISELYANIFYLLTHRTPTNEDGEANYRRYLPDSRKLIETPGFGFGCTPTAGAVVNKLRGGPWEGFGTIDITVWKSVAKKEMLGCIIEDGCKAKHIGPPIKNWTEGIAISPQNRGIETPYISKVWFEDDPFIPACCLE